MAVDKGNNPNTVSEEQILKELKQQEKRKAYMKTPKAIAARKEYMKKKYAETKATRDAIAALKESDPKKYAELMKIAANSAANEVSKDG